MGVFKDTKYFYSYDISDTLSLNIRNWLEYGLLELGAYTNVSFQLPTSGYTSLKRVQDEGLGGQDVVFEGMGPSWVWQTNIGLNNTRVSQPIVVSGIYINNTFFPLSTTGQYQYKVDYQAGRVVFKNPVPRASGVRCEYTFNDIGVYSADSRQWRVVVDEAIKNYDKMDQASPSGISAVLKEKRVWLPSVFIDVQNRTNEALQLGGGEFNDFAVFYHIISDRQFYSRRLTDILNNQETKTFTLYDVNKIPPIYKYDGTLHPSGLAYPTLSDRNGPYFMTYGSIESSRGGPKDNMPGFFNAMVIQDIRVSRYLSTY